MKIYMFGRKRCWDMVIQFYKYLLTTLLSNAQHLTRTFELGDIETNNLMLEDVLTRARREMRVELPASLWSRELPYIDILETPDYKDLAFVYTNLINCIYSKALGLSEEQQISEHFDVSMRIAEADLERQLLIEIARESVKKYQGSNNKWERAAAITTIMPHPTLVLSSIKKSCWDDMVN